MDRLYCEGGDDKDPWIFLTLETDPNKALKWYFEGSGRSMDPFCVTAEVRRIHGSSAPLRFTKVLR